MLVLPYLVIFGTFVMLRIMGECGQEEEEMDVVPIGSNNTVK
jgi:hypothetical protein